MIDPDPPPPNGCASPNAASSRPVWYSSFVSALGWALPLSCVGCQVADEAFCEACLARAAASAPPPRRLADGTLVLAGSAYADEVRRAIVAFKTEGFTVIDRRLATLLDAALAAAYRELAEAGAGEACRELDPDPGPGGAPGADARASGSLAAVRERDGFVTRRRPVLVVPVPSSRRGYRARGYRPVDRVLGRTGAIASPALAYLRQPSDQIGLGASARAENMRGTMRVTRRVEGRTVILVDDVCTTGATLREAAAVLRAAGARHVCAAVIAATPLRSLVAQPAQTVSDFSVVGDYGGAKGVEEPPELSGGTPYRGGRCGN